MMEFTTSNYKRWVGKEPRGTGGWAFQASETHNAFTTDLYGDVFFAGYTTYTEAKVEAKVFFGYNDAETVAVLG